jgi:hypothetical protein
MLHLPLPSRLDAVLEYTKHSRLLQFEHALKVRTKDEGASIAGSSSMGKGEGKDEG